YEDELREKSSQKMSKIIKPENQRIVNHIKEYDDKSTFFRYVDLSKTKQGNKEEEKKYIKKVSYKDFEPDLNRPTTALLVVNGSADEDVEVHYNSKDIPLRDLGKDLRSLAYYFSGIHTMFRTCLCNGF